MSRCLRLLAAVLLMEVATAAPADDIPAYRLGIDALSGHLWDLAAQRFEEALKTPELPDQSRQTILIRLAEARIRGGKPELAAPTLAHDDLKEHPERPFWQAQGLLAEGRFRDSLAAFRQLPENSPHRIESLLTMARIQRAIGDHGGAIDTLNQLLRIPKAPVAARILLASFLFTDGRTQEAIDATPDPARLNEAEANQVRLLRARCQLALGKAESAAALLVSLVGDSDDPLAGENQSLRDHHQAIIDLARARLALGKRQDAADGLLSFLPKNPKSPLLDEAFDVLFDCLPEETSPNDPILTRLREWAPPQPQPSTQLLHIDDRAVSALPIEVPPAPPLAAEALFHLALATRKLNLPDAAASSRRLLKRLRVEFPAHPLVARSLLELGRWELEGGRKDRAAACFDAINRLGQSSPPELRAQALAMEAGARFNDGDFATAARLFDESADLLENHRRRSARLNAASALLAAGDLTAFGQLMEKSTDPEVLTQLALERALYLASEHSPDALGDLIEFIRQNPGHPRLPEARLQAVLTSLDGPQPDLGQATAQFEALTESDRSSLPPAQLALAEVRLLGQSGRWAEAAARADLFIGAHATDPLLPLLTYEKGKALFRNKDFNEAGIILKSLARASPDAPQAPAALFLAARSAAEGATPQSKKEGIDLFRQLIDRDSPFRDVARIEMANLLISLSELDEAIAILDPWFKEMEGTAPLLTHVGLLLGDALYARAEGDPKLLQRVIDVQDRLLKTLPAESPVRARILYKKGRALEGFSTPAAEDEALMAYLDVVQSASGRTRADWESIELCGFAALQIYGKREEWLTAKKLAERIASLNGPRAADAAKRAKAIGQEQMLWDEDTAPEPDGDSPDPGEN